MSVAADLKSVRDALTVAHQWRSDPNDARYGDALAALDRLEATAKMAVQHAQGRGINIGTLLEGESLPTIGLF